MLSVLAKRSLCSILGTRCTVKPLPSCQKTLITSCRTDKHSLLSRPKHPTTVFQLASIQDGPSQWIANNPDDRDDSSHDCFSHGSFEDRLFELLTDGQDKVLLSRLIREINNTGLWKDDLRLKESMAKMNSLIKDRGGDVLIDKETLKDCIKDNIVLIRRAIIGDFVIPDFPKFCKAIDNIYWACRTNSGGKVSTYIPQLSRYSPDHWGVSLCTIDGQRHSIGDVDMPFTIQSGGKPINYALAINELGADVVHQYVGHEPSGETVRFIKLNHENKPHNPLINSGALVVASLIKNSWVLDERFDHVMNQYRRLSGNGFLSFNNATFLPEREIADRNYAIGYYLKDNKCFPDGINLHETLDLYHQLCSIEINVNSGAVMAATLANGGYCPITGEQVLSSTAIRNTLSLMHSCGMYDYSGGFAFKVGLPGKAAISGGILLVIPNVLGMCLWSPPLDTMGNSVRGIQFCEQLVSVFNFHHYNSQKHSSKENYDPRIRHTEDQTTAIVDLLFSAYNGDVTSLRRMALMNQDMKAIDYDGRTSLHLAASEGHLNCVQFLVEKCRLPVNVKDRWGRTPVDDAKMFAQKSVLQYLESCK